MSENEPKPDGEMFYRFEHRGKELEANTENTSVWSHLGLLAVYDCVQVDLNFIWQDNIHYNELLFQALINECAQHTHLRNVHSVILTMFHDDHLADLKQQDTMPQEWIDDEGPDYPQEKQI